MFAWVEMLRVKQNSVSKREKNSLLRVTLVLAIAMNKSYVDTKTELSKEHAGAGLVRDMQDPGVLHVAIYSRWF